MPDDNQNNLPALPDGQRWCEGFADSGSGGQIECSICNFYGNTDFPPDWAQVETRYDTQWLWDRKHGFRHPSVPFVIGGHSDE